MSSAWFTFNSKVSAPTEIPDLFPIGIKEADFVMIDVVNIYAKILTDALERTQGIKEELLPLFWDNCVQSESSMGIISLLAAAMANKDDLFLVYAKVEKIVRKATAEEKRVIEADYKREAKSSVGIYVSFECFDRTDMVMLYASLEYCVIASLNKTMNLSKAMQIKIGDLRGSVALNDKGAAESQVKSISDALSKGRDVYMDAKDKIELLTPDVASTEKSMEFIQAKRAFWLGLPTSYLTGEQTAGIGSTGEADMRAVERGLKSYYFSVLKPTIDALFEIKTNFKSQDFRLIDSGLEALKTFALIDDAYMSADQKKKIISKLFDLGEEEDQA